MTTETAHRKHPATHVSILNIANVLTVFRILLVPVYMWLFAAGTWQTRALALVVFITAAVTDLIDGRLARSRKEITSLGKFLDPLADKFLVLGALVQFWMVGLVWLWPVAIVVVRDVWVTGMRIVAILRGTELVTSGSAKLKTTIQLITVITIIVLATAQLMVVSFVPGYTGIWSGIVPYRAVSNGLVVIAAAFTIYSWAAYLFKRPDTRS